MDNNTSNKPSFFKKKFWYISLTLFIGIALSILFFFILYNFKDVNISLGKFFSAIKPFIYGAIIAYILVPMCNAYDRFFIKILSHRKGKKPDKTPTAITSLSIFLSLLTGGLIIYILLSLIIPQLIVSINVIVNNFDSYYQNVTDWVSNLFKSNETLHDYLEKTIVEFKDTATNMLKTQILPNTKTILSNISSSVIGAFSIVKNLFIGIIVSIYILASRRKFAAQLKIFVHAVFKKNVADKIITEVYFSNKMFMGFISGRLLDSAIIGCLCFIGLSIMKVPYPLLVSVIVGVTNIIPFFGPFIGGIPAGLIILMVDPVKCIWFIVFIVILQQLDGNIIGPKILGEMTNLNSFWVLFAILLSSGLFGFGGMLVGVPVFAVIYHLAQELIMRGLKRTGYIPTPEEAEDSLLNEYLEKQNMEPIRSFEDNKPAESNDTEESDVKS